jgi:hypothetical protein
MGRFFASILFLAACGDNLGIQGEDPGIDPTGGNVTDPLPRLVPEVCGFAQWTTVTNADPALQTSVVQRPYGATILAVPRNGGTMTGFAIDDRMNLMTDPNGTKVLTDATFSAVSASVVDNRLLATAVTADTTYVNLLNDDLTNPQLVAKLPGSFIAQPAFLRADSQTVIAVGGPDGVNMTQFDNSWAQVQSKLVGPSKPVSGLAATQYGSAVLAAWSTVSNECYVQMFAALTPGTQSHTTFACNAPRIAGDVANSTAKIVFEGAGNIRLMHVAHTQMGGDSVLLRPEGMSPRVVFDGNRYWVSYIDARGDVVVGYLDANNQLVSMGIVGPKPAHDAYELVMVDNHPWVFTTDPTNGYTAHRMCLTAGQ